MFCKHHRYIEKVTGQDVKWVQVPCMWASSIFGARVNDCHVMHDVCLQIASGGVGLDLLEKGELDLSFLGSAPAVIGASAPRMRACMNVCLCARACVHVHMQLLVTCLRMQSRALDRQVSD